jgi:hypothetical protein
LKKNGPKIFRDDKGEYIRKSYFVNGKQKFMKMYVVDEIPADEYYEKNADPITLLQNGDYELLQQED